MDRFEAVAREFLAQHLDVRRPVSDVVWGEGSDAVVAGAERDRGAAGLRAACNWRRMLFDAGFGWIEGPRRFGGQDLTPDHAALLRRLEAGFEAPDPHLVRFGVSILCPALLEFGSEYLQDRYLRPLKRGDLVACQLFSEPGAGSDLAALTTKAVRDGDDWLVSGHKVWSSGAHLSDLGLAIVRTSAEPGEAKQAGLTALLIDLAAEGVEVRPIQQLNGDSRFNEVRLDRVRVPDSHRVGEVGDGWSFVTTSLRHERASIGADGAVDADLVPRLVALAHHVGAESSSHVRQAIAEVYVRAVATRAMTTGLFVDAGAEGPGPAMAACKLELTQNIQRGLDVAMEMLGERAVVDTGDWGTFSWSQLAWRLPGMRIGGGTDEILRNVIAERVLGLPREPRR
jgi:alkylation response protein AidB-like acyl-CoA dehydrogenase